VTRDELADYAENTIRMSRERFTGVGAVKYQITPDEQAFERSSIAVMLAGLREELLDQINYIVMTDILIQRRLAQLAQADELSLAPGEDYVDALNREVGDGWEAKREA
jgi:hypothetical protein